MLTALEVKRLMDLLSKGETNLSDAERAELTTLRTKAGSAAASAAASAPGATAGTKTAATDDATAMSEDDVKRLVTEGVTTALKDQPSVTADQVKGIVETALGSQRRAPKMQHPAEAAHELDLPIAHRAGNLSVAMKQLLNVMTGKPENDGIGESLLRDAEQRGQRAEKRLMHALRTKAGFTTSDAGAGAEFMNETLGSVLLQRMYLESQLAAYFASREVPMPTNPFHYPLGTTLPSFYVTNEGADPTESTAGTGELTLNAKKLTGIVPYTYEADEDSIIAILPHTIAQLGEAAGQALEDAIINGDTAGTHQDSDYNAVTGHHAKLFDGMRKLALAQTPLKISLATGGISTANIGVLRKALGRWGVNPKNLVIIAGVAGYNDLIMLPETLTAEKAGSQSSARVLTGVAPNLLGMDIIPSPKMREDLDANGVYSGSPTTKGSIMIAYLPGWLQGVRRGFTLETDVDKKKQKRYVIASFRRDFKPVESLANVRAAVLGYNYNSGA